MEEGKSEARVSVNLRPLGISESVKTPIRDLAMLDIELPGLCREIISFLGSHNLEATYQRALKIDLEERGIRVAEEVEIPLMYKGRKVGTRRADLVINMESGETAILEIKAVNALSGEHLKQLEFYLSNFKIIDGYLINFPHDSGFPPIDSKDSISFETKLLCGRDNAIDRNLRAANRRHSESEPDIVRVVGHRLASDDVTDGRNSVGGGSGGGFASKCAASEKSHKKWPAITQKGAPCKLCLKQKEGLFCEFH